MYYQIRSYLNFLLRSTNQHGVHSPFVYKLVTECFYDKGHYSEYKLLKNYRKTLQNTTKTIEVTDFGAGSRVFKSNVRSVAAIAKNAGITTKRQELLFRLVKFFNSENILELGTSLGMATAALSLGNPSAKVYTVEGCPNTRKKALELFKDFKLKNIELHATEFQHFLSSEITKPYDLVYLDGSHNKEKTLQYFEILIKQTNNNSVIIFDDIYWSKSMTEAWNEIIQHPKVTVSIDTFYWGLIFFRREQKKQHFTIRL